MNITMPYFANAITKHWKQICTSRCAKLEWDKRYLIKNMYDCVTRSYKCIKVLDMVVDVRSEVAIQQ